MKKETARQKKISELMHLFLYTNRLHRSMVEEKLSDLEVHSSQHHMLAIIAENKSICQKDIAQKLDISSAAVAVTLNKLEGAGYISRSQSFDDARKNHITITDSGVALLKKTKQIFDAMDAEMFEDVTDEEIEQMTAILSKLSAKQGK